jgi:hypothetical protein
VGDVYYFKEFCERYVCVCTFATCSMVVSVSTHCVGTLLPIQWLGFSGHQHISTIGLYWLVCMMMSCLAIREKADVWLP